MTAPTWDDAARRRLILDLTYADRRAGAASLWKDVYPLVRRANVAELSELRTRALVTRFQEGLGARAWARIVVMYEAGS